MKCEGVHPLPDRRPVDPLVVVQAEPADLPGQAGRHAWPDDQRARVDRLDGAVGEIGQAAQRAGLPDQKLMTLASFQT